MKGKRERVYGRRNLRIMTISLYCYACPISCGRNSPTRTMSAYAYQMTSHTVIVRSTSEAREKCVYNVLYQEVFHCEIMAGTRKQDLLEKTERPMVHCRILGTPF